jgi:riboflavin kinase/FMN adenylyltransferase
MRVFRHFEALPAAVRGAAVAVGNFDGVHLGHRAVIDEAGVIAKDAGRPWAVLTFEPHPRRLFEPKAPPFRLTPFHAKARAIQALGVDVLVVQRFNRAFSMLTAESFVGDVLACGIGASHVVAGYDFVFGNKRKGDCQLLLAMGKRLGFGFTAVNAVQDPSGQVYSSTRVRESLAAGNPKGAQAVLGRPFEIEGRVIQGDKRGRVIGFPTANLRLGQYLRPATGVYAVRVAVGGGEEWRDGVANFGNRPTFAGQDVLLETFLFDFSGNLYGRRLRVRLVDYLRPEKKFDGIAELKAQIAADTARARQILAAA